MYLDLLFCLRAVLSASDIRHNHCVIHNADGVVELEKCNGDCYVNTLDVADSKRLTHGMYTM